MRIISLVPSATEIACALGLADRLVGISGDCDFPPEICGKPVLSNPIITPDLSSPAIDRRVRARAHTGTSVYHLDEAEVARLRPDLILTQELCAVCAPSFTTVTRTARMLDAPVRVVSLEPAGLLDVLDNILLVGDLTGTEARARRLVRRLRGRIDAVTAGAAGPRPRVAVLEWLDPVYVGGHWVPEMVAAAGGTDVLGAARAPSRGVEWDAVCRARPEVLVLAACGFDVARTRAEAHLLTTRPGWDDLPAVQGGRVYVTDASSYFNRPGPRIVAGLEILASILHPGAFSFPLPPGAVEPL